MRGAILFVMGAVLALAGAVPLSAQQVTWEFLGPVVGLAEDLHLVEGAFPDADTLYVAGSQTEMRRYPPGGPWSEDLHGIAQSPDIILVTKEGYYLAIAIGIDRSTDRGQTWESNVYRGNMVSCLIQTTLPVFGGAVLACRRVAALLRSDDAGATWATSSITPISGEGTGSLWALAEVPVSEALPQGRLLAATNLGVLYSDDGAETWQTSELWRRGETYFLARHDDPAHPFGGTVYASAPAVTIEGPPSLWASEDGGTTWEQRTIFDMASYGYKGPYPRAPIVAGADGSVWMGLTTLGPNPNFGTMVRSTDSGFTWETVGAPPEVNPDDGWGGFAANDLLFDRRGVLWAATERGVYRTTAPVVVVAVEEPLGEPAEALALGVPYPNPAANPAGATVTVRLALSEAAEARVVVYDVLGRTVAVLADGRHEAGAYDLTVATGGLAAGVYVVRAVSGTATAVQTFTVAR